MPLRRRFPRGAQEDRAVLHISANLRHSGDRRRHDLPPCRRPTTSKAYDEQVCAHFGLTRQSRAWALAMRCGRACAKPEGEVHIAIVGKYTHLLDSYKIARRGADPRRHRTNRQGQLDWIDSRSSRRKMPSSISRACTAIRRSRRFRRTRRRGQDYGGALARERRGAVFSASARHADGGDRVRRVISPACPTPAAPSSDRAASR